MSLAQRSIYLRKRDPDIPSCTKKGHFHNSTPFKNGYQYNKL